MVGELVMERFRLEERIGSGGMGTVYRAFDERLQRHVAVKEVMVSSPERVAREAQATARLSHQGIVALFELGIEGHRALLVSELIEGETLDVLAASGVLCDRDAAELGADVAEALEHAHERGVVHRDVKPQNVIARDEGGAGRRAKLTDFGIATVVGAPTLTAPGEVVGTLAYMSPEQADGERAGPASDTYSLALTLYECWAGENPVRRATPAQTARAVGSELPSLASHRPDLPPRLCDLIDACLDADPDLRPPLAELRAALQALGPGLDCRYALPAAAVIPKPGPRGPAASGLARAGALVALAAACVALAGPAGLPGLALIASLLALPPLLLPARAELAGLPGLALVLGALSAGGAYPAAVAALARSPLHRLAMGAIGWAWLLTGCAALGIAPPAGLLERPPAGWAASAADALDALILPLFEGPALLGMGLFAAAAAALGVLLEVRQLALAALAALVWAAGLAAGLALAGEGGMHWAPAVIAASALIAVAAEYRSRAPSAPAEASPATASHASPTAASAP